MSEDEPSYHEEFHTNGLVVMAFLGGIAFAALVLVLQAHKTFQPVTVPVRTGHVYFDALIFALSAVSFTCLIGSQAMVFVLSGAVSTRGRVSHFAFLCLAVSTVAFTVTLPFLLLIFSTAVSNIMAVLIVVVEVLFVVLLWFDAKAKKRASQHEVIGNRYEDEEPQEQGQKEKQAVSG